MRKIPLLFCLILFFISVKSNAQLNALKVGGSYNIFGGTGGSGKPNNSGGIALSYEHAITKRATVGLSLNYFAEKLEYNPGYTPSISDSDHILKSSTDNHYTIAPEYRLYFNSQYQGLYFRAALNIDFQQYYKYTYAGTKIEWGNWWDFNPGVGVGYSLSINNNFKVEIQTELIGTYSKGYPGYILQSGINAVYKFGKQKPKQ